MIMSSIPEEHWERLKSEIECLFQEKGVEIETCLNLPMSHGHVAQDERSIVVLLEREDKYLEMFFGINVESNNFGIDSVWTLHEHDKVRGECVKVSQISLNQFFDKWSSK